MPRQPPVTIEFTEDLLSTWIESHSDASMARQAETLPLRQDMVMNNVTIRSADLADAAIIAELSGQLGYPVNERSNVVREDAQRFYLKVGFAKIKSQAVFGMDLPRP